MPPCWEQLPPDSSLFAWYLFSYLFSFAFAYSFFTSQCVTGLICYNRIIILVIEVKKKLLRKTIIKDLEFSFILNSGGSVKEYSALIRKQLHSAIRVNSTIMLPIRW